MRVRVLPSLVIVGQECPTYISLNFVDCFVAHAPRNVLAFHLKRAIIASLVRGVAIHLLLITEKFWVTLFAQNFSRFIKINLIYPSILSEIFLFTPVSTASFATLTAFLIA